jgi:N-acetyl-anhydromuramyl-L-alanine amidase AmpD
MALDILERPSPHCSARPSTTTIDCIVVHDTESETAKEAVSWFESAESKVSAHYVVDRDGTLYRCVPDDRRAWHAGGSVLAGRANVNDYSIGIELAGFASRPYPEAQIDALVELCVALCLRHPAITVDRIVGHEHVAMPPGRKTDPGPHFPWDTVRARIQLELNRGIA